MDTHRISFIDIDQSYTLPVPDTTQTGFMVVRAPKGNAEALYFPKGQAQLIHSMIGIPTADWPDIQDAIDYNNQFGIWISAPAGTSEDYPSTVGGMYLTSMGLTPFYGVNDPQVLNYQSTVSVTKEKTDFPGAAASNAIVNPSVYLPADPNHDSFAIESIPGTFAPYILKLRVKFWGNTAAVGYEDPAEYELYADGANIKVISPIDNEPVTVGTISGTTWTITGQAPTTTGFFYLDFAQLVAPASYLNGDTTAWLSGNSTAYKTAVTKALAATLSWVVDVEEIAYLAIAQKSATEKPTRITISNIGYEKYYYDKVFSAYMTPNSGNLLPTASQCLDPNRYFVQITENTGVFQSAVIKQVVGNTLSLVTHKFKTKYIKIGAAPADPTTPAHAAADTYVGKIFYVTSSGVMVECTTAGTYPYKLDPTFNTVTFKVEEEVYPGKWISGGTFTGSLNESSVDSFGAKNYFPEVLPDNANTFVEVAVKKSFDTSLTETNSSFMYYKEIDAREYLKSSSYVGYLQGTRYIAKLVADTIATGSVGGVLTESETPVLLEGWTEAMKSIYDENNIFMEPTGCESLKETILALRQASHKLSTFIAPRLLSLEEATDVDIIAVTGRSTGITQPVNEFLRKDSYTGKKYWTSLVGAYGAKLSKILQDKMGGWAPMYTDIGGIGGQLNIKIEKQKYDFSVDDQKILEAKGLNAMTYTPAYGVMLVGQRTAQDPTNTTDWSYLGHSMAFDLFKREVRDKVMIPQLGKPNDPYYQEMRQKQVEAILGRRIGGLTPIWAAGKVEVASVNTPEVKAQRTFKIKVSVKVNVFSEYVVLEFVNVSQLTSF